MPICIYTKQPFKDSTKEHILQNSLGARKVSNAIVSNDAQKLFGETIDRELEVSIRPIRTLVGSMSGRRDEAQPLNNLVAENGEKFHIEAGGKPVAVEPSYEVKALPDGSIAVTLKVNHPSQLDWALHKVRTENPSLNLSSLSKEEMLKTASNEERYLDAPIKIGFSLGGDPFYRAILKACFNLVGVNNADIALRDEFDPVRTFILTGQGNSPDFGRIILEPFATEGLVKGDFGHFLSVYSVDGKVNATCVLFGSFQYSLRLANEYSGPDFAYSYRVDPLRETDPAEDTDFQFDTPKFPAFEGQAFKTAEHLFAAGIEMFTHFMRKYMARAQRDEVKRIVEKHLLPHDGELLTKEMLALVAHDVAKFAVRRMSPPQE